VDETTLDPTGQRLAYALNGDGEAEIVIRTLASGNERSIAGLPPGALYEYWQHALAWDRSGQQLAISWTASRANPNVFVASLSTHEAQPATRAGAIGVNADELAEPEHVQYPTFDGRRQIPALFYPAPASRGGPAPCVVFVHGGPESQYRPSFQPVVQGLVAAGFAVLAPNVRGSTGYGRSFYEEIDYGGREVDDVYQGLEWMLGNYEFLDPKRVGIIGWSHGGLITLMNIFQHPQAYDVVYAAGRASDQVDRMGYEPESCRARYSAPYHIGKSVRDDIAEYDAPSLQ